MDTQLDAILSKAKDNQPLLISDLEVMLNAQGEDSEKLYAYARSMREKHFGNRLFAYGFIYFSTYCKNNCTFCYYRKSNKEIERYRKSAEEILEISQNLANSGVNLLDLTLGEDPLYVNNDEGIEKLMHIATEIKSATNLPLMISPGVLKEKYIKKAKTGKVDFYACYQETHNQDLFSTLRCNQSYQTRLQTKIDAKNAGMLVEEGILVGVGESATDIAHSIMQMKALNAAQIRVMSFVPQSGAPLKQEKTDNLYLRELNTIAVMRIVMPNRFIPASLDVAGKDGLKERLNAGANIVTSIIVPKSGLAGVSNATLDVDNGRRSLPGIQNTVKECGMQMGTNKEFSEELKKLYASTAVS